MHYYLRPEKRRYKELFRALARSRLARSVALLAVVALLIVTLVDQGSFSLLAMHGRMGSRANRAQDSVELLRNGTWSYHPGVTVTKDGLTVKYVGMAIVEQDGTNPMPNPPLNLYGTRLDTDGDFEITAKLSDRDGGAQITLYSHPPIILDEDRAEAPAIQIAVKDNVTVSTYASGHRNAYEKKTNTEFVPQKDSQITITRQNRRIKVTVDGKNIAQLNDRRTFNDGQVWFGMESVTPGGSWNLRSLEARGINSGKVAMVDTSRLDNVQKNTNNFQDVVDARNGKTTVGAAVSLEPLVADAKYRDIAAGMYGGWTTENALKMQFTEPQRGVYTFGPADAIFDMAKKHDIKMHLHTLVFGEANPTWVQDIARNNSDELKNVTTDYIKTVVGRYKDRVYSIDVVNEPLADYDDFIPGSAELRKNIWYEAMGEDYIDIAFREAHVADPNAILFMNEFGLEGSVIDGDDTERWDAFLALIDRLLARGVPIQGVGFQAHVYEDGDEINPAVFRDRINELKKRGLVFRISEVDVHTDNGVSAQTIEYASIAGICKEFADSCVSITTWGVSDTYGSTGYVDDDGSFIPGEGLLFDKNQEPVPAGAAFRSALQ